MSPNGMVLLQAFINSALVEENYNKYELLSKQVADVVYDNPSPQLMARWLQSFTLCVSSFDHIKHSQIVMNLLSIRWFEYDMFDDYADFVENLVSAQVTFTPKVVEKLLHSLLEIEPLNQSENSEKCLDLLIVVIEMVPTVISSLIEIIKCVNPTNFDSLKVHLRFIKTLLALADHFPAIKSNVLELLIIKILQLDVEIQVKVEELCDEDADVLEQLMERNVEELFDMKEILENDLTNVNRTEIKKDKIGVVPSAEASLVLHSLIILDQFLSVLFEYTRTIDTEFFKSVLCVFERTVLRTFKSRYVQFILFYATSFDAKNHRLFLGHLLSIPFKKNVPIAVKLNSIAYLSSYMARARFLDSKQLVDAYHLLLVWCERYIDECQDNYVDYERHLLFYAISQCLFYVFCFRHTLLLQDKVTLLKTGLERIIFNALNPLSICLKAIVEEFARLSSEHDFIFCYSLIEKNQREEDKKEGGLLESFFPFDPYKLFSTKKFISKELYVEWGEAEN